MLMKLTAVLFYHQCKVYSICHFQVTQFLTNHSIVLTSYKFVIKGSIFVAHFETPGTGREKFPQKNP